MQYYILPEMIDSLINRQGAYAHDSISDEVYDKDDEDDNLAVIGGNWS